MDSDFCQAYGDAKFHRPNAPESEPQSECSSEDEWEESSRYIHDADPTQTSSDSAQDTECARGRTSEQKRKLLAQKSMQLQKETQAGERPMRTLAQVQEEYNNDTLMIPGEEYHRAEIALRKR